MKLTNKIIFIISPESWGENYVSKHHYTLELAKLGNKIYFFSPPSNTENITHFSENIAIINYRITKGLNLLPLFIRKHLQSIIWKIIKRNLNLPAPDVVWSFDPFVFQDLSIFNKEAIKIYHPVDVHYTSLEYDCASTSDIIFSTAHLILDKFKNINKHKYFINHGLAEHFINIKSSSRFDYINNNKNIKVGYVGNLRYQHLDYPNLFKTIEKNPDLTFYFAGPYESSNLSKLSIFEYEIQKLKQYHNVILLGSIPSVEIPVFLSKMDILLMCYLGANKPAEMANPHKILEYISSGKTILTHYIDEYKNSALFEMVNDNELIPQKIRKISIHINNHKADSIKLQTYASNNTYRKQIERIENYIFQYYHRI